MLLGLFVCVLGRCFSLETPFPWHAKMYSSTLFPFDGENVDGATNDGEYSCCEKKFG